ncbi:hypothetical protein D3C78_1579320 [compost metagenome]
MAAEPFEQVLEPARFGLGFGRGLGGFGRFFAETITNDGLGVLERWGVEDCLDTVPGGFAGEGLVEQSRAVGAAAVLIGKRRGRQRQQHEHQQHQHRGHAAQALAQASEHQLDVPRLEDRAPVQVEAETAGDIYRLP